MKYIRDYKEGDRMFDIYLCKHKQSAVTKNGKPYETVILQDKTGTIDAKVWDPNNAGISEFDTLDYIEVYGDVNSFQGALQVNVKRIRVCHEGEYDPADYLPVSKKNIDEMYKELLGLIGRTENEYLKKLLESFFVEDEAFIRAFRTSSAAKTVHHGFVGGLLEHTLSVAKLCEYFCKTYPILKRDLLIAAALCHDIGKTKELSLFPENDYTDDGQLLARGDLKGGLDLAVRHGDPAGVETQLLGPQYDLLPVVPAGFLQVRGLLSDQRDVVFYAGELPVVGRKPSESSGLIQNKLDVKPALPVALGDARQQCFSRLRRDGPVLVGADRMPVLHGLEQIHNCIPPVIAAVNPRRSCPERFSGSAECLRTGALRFRSHCPAGPDSRRRESLLFGLLSRLSPAEPAGGGDNRTRSRSCRVSPPKAVNRFRHGWNSLRRCAGS